MFVIIGLVLSFLAQTASAADNKEGYRLSVDAQYLILAPKTVRPSFDFRLRVSLFRLYGGDEVRVRATLSRNNDSYATNIVTFREIGTKDLVLEVPETVYTGEHRLHVEGLVGSGFGQAVFSNNTKLEFQSKYISVFIQTDRSIYFPTQKVFYRVLAVTPDLRPVSGAITVYILDGNKHVVRRWKQQQLNLGLFEGEFALTYPVKTGTWSVQVGAFGHTYETPFEVEFFFHGYEDRRLEVNVTVPISVTEAEWGIIGDVYGEHLSGIAASGNVTVMIQMRDQNGTFFPGSIFKYIAWYKGSTPFHVSMEELREEFGTSLAGYEIFFTADLHDWTWHETQSGTAVTKIVEDGVLVRRMGRKIRTFKPTIPTVVYFAVSQRDLSPYTSRFNRLLEVSLSFAGGSTRSSESKVVIPDDGIVAVHIHPQEQDQRISVWAWHPASGQNTQEVILYRYYSPSEKYISVVSSTQEPTVNDYMVFTVRTNVYVEEVNYLIMGAGRIIIGDAVRMKYTQKTFAVAISREMSPRARIVVYFMHKGEVITDALNFHVKDSRLLKDRLNLNLGKDFSFDTLELIGHSSPGGYMVFSGCDYELYRRGSHTFIDETVVTRELATYDESNQGPFEHVWWHHHHGWESSVYRASPTAGMDTLSTFYASGVVALTDRNMTRRPDWYGEVTICNGTLGMGMCPNGQCYQLDKKCDGIVDCLDGYDEVTCPDEEPPIYRPADIGNLGRMSRYYSDVDWLWKTSYVKHHGRAEPVINVPEYTNPYVISAFAIHPVEGLSIVKQPVMHDVTRPFFMIMEMPSSTRRGEQIGIRLALYNFLDENNDILVTLHGNDDFRFVMVEDFGYASSYAPRLSAGDHQIMVTLQAGDYTYTHIPIVPVIFSGDVTVTVSAYTHYGADVESFTFSVSYDGFANTDHTPYLIDLVNQGSVIIPDFDIPIPDMFQYPEEPWHRYIPGSEAATYTLFGDLVTPGFYTPYFDSDIVAGIPHDCAIGYMFEYAINLQTLSFLLQSNQLTESQTDGAVEYLKSILMRQYTYMEPDGSFKMYRRDDYSSVWVTAFVSKWLHQTQLSEWSEDLYITSEIQNKIALWLANQQDQKTGVFKEIVEVYNTRYMLPTSVDKNGTEHEWHVPLTAYVLITLAENTQISGEAQTQSKGAMELAGTYLASKLYDLTDPYQVAITAYALQRAGHPSKDEAFSQLVSMRREGEFIYWADYEIEPNPTEFVNANPIQMARPYHENFGKAVTATAYALKLYLDRNLFEQSVPIMKWLQTQRTGTMKFSSTLDSLEALEALAQFSLRQTNKAFYNIRVSLDATATSRWHQIHDLNKTNFAVLYEGELPRAHGHMRAVAQGTGYAMLQMDFGSNVEKEWLVSGPEFGTYDIKLEHIGFYGRNASIMEMRVCTSWARPDLYPVASTTVMTISIPTGYVVQRHVRDNIYRQNIPGLKRIRFRDNTLIVFWQNVTTEPRCLHFTADRFFPVANVSIPHGIVVYQYEETGMQKNTLYSAYTLFHQHICQVCGSYQCPYCQGYNKAPLQTSNVWTVLFLWTFVIFITWNRLHL